MTPACRKRGFASVDILAAWPDIVGGRYGTAVRPHRLIWPRRVAADGEPLAEPATLVVHTDGATALLLSHEIPQVLQRINRFYGWAAVNRIKIIQRPLEARVKDSRPALRGLTGDEEARLENHVASVSDHRLREALRKLGAQVIARAAHDAATPGATC